VQVGLQISMQDQAKKYQNHWYTDKKGDTKYYANYTANYLAIY
jgi:hypothetical protein